MAYRTFPISTEIQINRIWPLLDSAPEGVYITVGGERAFRGASMFKEIRYLIIIDSCPVVSKFNEINVKLLSATNKEVYKFLRWSSSYEDWKNTNSTLTEGDFEWWKNNIRNIKGCSLAEELNRYGKSLVIDKYLRIRRELLVFYPLLQDKFNKCLPNFLLEVRWEDIFNVINLGMSNLNKADFQWWKEQISKRNSQIKEYIESSSPLLEIHQVIDYKTGNYLFDDTLYKRLHILSQKNKILSFHRDLKDPSTLQLVEKYLFSLRYPLSVLDLNNLHITDYMGEIRWRNLITHFLKFGMDTSILLTMKNYEWYASAQIQTYFGFTFKNVQKWPQGVFFDQMIQSIPKALYPLLNGKLYDEGDEFPFDF